MPKAKKPEPRAATRVRGQETAPARKTTASPLRGIPVILKHMTVAIYNGRFISGVGVERFLNAFNVARFRLSQYGHLEGGSDTGPVSNIRLTDKGKQLEKDKAGTIGTAEKQAMFDRMFLQWERLNEAAKKP